MNLLYLKDTSITNAAVMSSWWLESFTTLAILFILLLIPIFSHRRTNKEMDTD